MPIQEQNTIRKINTTGGGNTGINYLTNEDSITVEGTQYTIDNGFNFGEVSDAVRDRAKYKQSLNIGSTIPEVTLNSSIVLLEEYNEAKRYAYSSHNYIGSNSSDGTVNETLNLPKRLDGWKYYTGSGYATLPEGTNLGEALIAYFSDNNNLNVYANWADDVKAIRVVVYPETPIPGITPRCSVSITSNTHTNGLLTSNYSKMLHRKASILDDIENWAFVANEFGSCSVSEPYGNGCPMIDSNYDGGKPVPCYYGFKSGDSGIDITISGFDATDSVGRPLSSVYKPHETSGTPQYYEVNNLSAYTSIRSPQYSNLTQGQNNTYTITKTNLTSDLTVFIPVIANTFTITAKCEDVDSQTLHSQKGYVDIVSLLRSTSPVDTILTTQCVNSEQVKIEATVKTGYVFAYWERTINDSTITINDNPTYLTISSNVNNATFIAHFTQGNYTLTYHKEILI
jgi:hypothetical protein